jgi:hypothetical protein
LAICVYLFFVEHYFVQNYPITALNQLATRAMGPPLAIIPPSRLAAAQIPMAQEESPITAKPTFEICTSTLSSVRTAFFVLIAAICFVAVTLSRLASYVAGCMPQFC